MSADFYVLGCMEGRLLACSGAPDFAQAHALACGSRLVPFEPSALEPDALLAEVNLLGSGEVFDGSAGWKRADPAARLRIGQDINADWTLRGHHTGFIEVPPGQGLQVVRYHDRELGAALPVRPGKPYVACGRFGAHRCSGRFRVVFLDGQGRTLGEKEAPISNQFRGGPELQGYQAVHVAFTPEAAVAAVRLEVVYAGPVAEAVMANPNGFIFMTHCALVQSARPGLPAWRAAPDNVGTLLQLFRRDTPGRLYEAAVDVDAAAQAGVLKVVALGAAQAEAATFALQDLSAVTARIQPLEGNALPLQVHGYDGRLLLWVDGELAAATAAAATPGLDRMERVLVAERWCDGQAHLLELRDALGVRVLARDLQLFPAALTPWPALQSHTNPPYPYHLASAAAFRYKALNAQLAALQPEAPAEQAAAQLRRLAALPALHRVLEGGFERVRGFGPLDFPRVEAPRVSVIVPVHDKFNVTYCCLAALLFAANRASFEVVVVDDGSEDQTLELARIAPNVTVCRHDTAQGFVRACNLGARHARGEFLVFLNNDTEPTVGWLDELLQAFDGFEGVGLAGAKLLYPDGRLQEAGGIVWNNGNPWNYGRLANPWDPRYCYARQADYLSGAAVMLPRKVWDEVGGFSDEFAPAYFEDTDLCFKVRAAGYQTWFVPTAVVYHFEGVSNGTDVGASTGLKRFQEVNRPKFKRKWAAAVQHNGEEGRDPDLAKDRGILGRVLFVDYQTPKPDVDAGSYAAVQEMRLVQSLGYKVTFIATNLAWMGRYDEDLQRLGIETVYAPFHLSLEDFLQQRGREFDVVFMTRYYVARDALPSVRRHAPQAKLMFNNADLHFLRELRAALRSRSEEALQRVEQVREEELGVMREVDVVLSYNEVEHAVILSHNLGHTRVVRCPWVVEPRAARAADGSALPGFGQRQGLAFLGGYGHPPNVEAVEFFVQEVMPLLRRRLPGVAFHVYGSKVPPRLQRLACEDVRIEGWVETVDAVYDRHRVFVAPLLSGAGIKGKVLGALAHGVPCVLSPVAAESTGVRDGLDCRIAADPEQWAQAIAALYEDPEAWQALSRHAMAFTDRFYSFAQGRELMKQAFEAVGIYRTR